jgi:hypothetical protein
MQSKPDSDDYLALFGRYKEDFGDVYMDPEDERFRLLFDQICRLLTQPSAFNLSLPARFRTTAFRYLEGDAHTLAHMTNVENRHFMLSDLFDLYPSREDDGWLMGSARPLTPPPGPSERFHSVKAGNAQADRIFFRDACLDRLVIVMDGAAVRSSES